MMPSRAILAMVLICGCFSALAEPIHLQLRWHHQFQFAGYYAALEKGYYQAAGLDVIIDPGAPDKKPVPEVVQGRAHYGVANSELLLERLRGAPLIALAAIYQHSPSVLIARKDAGIFSPDDLVGKKVMLLDQAVDADFVAMFYNEGVDAKHIQVIPSSYDINDLINGKVDAFNAYLSNEPYLLKQQGVEFTVLNPRNYGADFYSDILFTTEHELKQHPERVKAFRQASLEGWYYAMNHPHEIINLLLNKYNVAKTKDHLEFEAEAIRSLILPDIIELGQMNPWRWRQMAETFIEAELVANDRFLAGFSYDPDPKADKEKLRRYIKIAVVITLLTIIVALILLMSFRSLKRKNKIAARNEKLLRLAHETAGIGYFVTNLTTGNWESSDLLDQIFGIDAHFERSTDSCMALIHPDHRQRVLDYYQATVFKGQRFAMEYPIIRANDKAERWISAHGDVDCDKAGKAVQLVGTVQDITERKTAEQDLRSRTDELALQNRILQLINEGSELSIVLHELASQIEVLHGDMLSSILLLDADGKHLRHGAAPSLPDFYNQAIDGIAIGDGVGSCGTAAYRGELVIVENVQQHPYWEPYRELIAQADLQACWSQPIKNNQGEVLGTFAVYHRLPAQPGAAEIRLIEYYAGLAQLAIEQSRSRQQIAESLALLKATLEATGEAILAVDLNNNWLLHNQKFTDMWHVPDDIIAAKTGSKDGHPERLYGSDQIKDSEAFAQKVTELYATPEAHSFDIIEFKDGKIVERYSIPKVINNEVVGRVWSFRDITEQKQAEAELCIAATAFELQQGMSITDAKQIILKVNKAFTHVTGYSPDEVIGQSHALLNSGQQDAEFYNALQHELKQNGYWEGEIWNKRKNGDIYPAWLNITTVRDANHQITHYVVAFTDITKDKEAEQTIHNLAYYDPLTALPNRRLLWERLKHGIDMERRDGKQLALLMLDLDRFKAVNDSMGHLAGDELLQQVATRIKSKLRDVDTVARLGGDEFVVLLEDITRPEDAGRIAGNIVADLSRPFQLLKSSVSHPELSQNVRIGTSIGISLFPQHGDKPETLLDNADIALYRAKDEGRGCFAYFSEEFTVIARERLALETRLRHAIRHLS